MKRRKSAGRRRCVWSYRLAQSESHSRYTKHQHTHQHPLLWRSGFATFRRPVHIMPDLYHFYYSFGAYAFPAISSNVVLSSVLLGPREQSSAHRGSIASSHPLPLNRLSSYNSMVGDLRPRHGFFHSFRGWLSLRGYIRPARRRCCSATGAATTRAWTRWCAICYAQPRACCPGCFVGFLHMLVHSLVHDGFIETQLQPFDR